MEKSPFSRFIAFIQYDQSLHSLEKEIEKCSAKIALFQAQQDLLVKECEMDQGLVHQLQKQVHEQELVMKDLDSQERTKRERSESATTTKEYQAFKKESDQLKHLQHEQEQILVSVWNGCESAQKSLKAKELLVQEKKVVLVQEMEKQEVEKNQLLAKLSEHELLKVEMQQNLPEEWLEKYTRMRSTISNPVVSGAGGICGGCSYALSNQTTLALQQKKLVQCSGCYRLLYLAIE